MNKPTRVISMLMAICILFSSYAMICASASGAAKRYEIMQMLPEYLEQIVELENVKDIRTDVKNNEITLKMKDGSYTTYSFEESVWYDSPEGMKFKDTQIEKQSNTSLNSRGYTFSNGYNDYSINFSENLNKGVLIDYEDASFTIVPKTSVKPGKVTASAGEDRFSYSGIYGSGTKLTYILKLNGLKEEITLDKFSGQNQFKFIVETDNCYLEKDENGCINVKSAEDDSVIQTIDPPFAYDSKGNEFSNDEHYSNDCEYSVKKISDREFELTLTVSEDWLTSKSTVYPVTIDPVTSNISNAMDATIYESYPFAGGNPDGDLEVGYVAGYKKARSLIKFDLPSSITANAKINDAKLWLYNSGNKTSKYIAAHLVTGTWAENVEWKNAPSYNTAYFTRKICNGGSTADSGTSWYAFDIKPAVESWTSGIANNGILLKYEQEPTSMSSTKFVSRESIMTSNRPYTVINYTLDESSPTYESVTGYSSDWQMTPVTLTVNGAADADSGIHSLGYSFSNAQGVYNWQSSNISPQYTTPQTVYVYIRDADGNITNCGSYNIKVDTEAPTITDVSGGNRTDADGNATLKINGATDGNGIGLHSSPYSFSLTQGSYSWQSSDSKVFSKGQTVYVYVRDKLDNIRLCDTVTVTETKYAAPVITSVTVTNSILSMKKVTVTATDSDSSTIYYSFDGGSTWSTTNSKTVTSANLANVVVKVKDAEGNIAVHPGVPPTDLRLVKVSDTAAEISWTAPASPAVPVVAYNVYCNDTLVGTTTDTGTVINGLSNLTTYSFTVKALNMCDDLSAATTPLVVTAKVAAPKPTVSSISKTSINLKWDTVYGAQSYEVKCEDKVYSNITGTSYSLTGLETGKEYDIQVRAIGQTGTSTWSYIVRGLTSEGTHVSGHISQNTTWNKDGHPYIVSGQLTIDPGVTLTIEPGTVVLFQDADGMLLVSGTLKTLGTADENVVFTSTGNPEYGRGTNLNWGGIAADENSSLNLNYTEISQVRNFSAETAAILSLSPSVQINNCNIHDSYIGILQIPTPGKDNSFVLKNNNISDIDEYGIAYLCEDNVSYGVTTADISGNTISGAKFGTAFAFRGNTFNFSNNSFYNCIDCDTNIAKMTVNSFTGFETNTFTGDSFIFDFSLFTRDITIPQGEFLLGFPYAEGQVPAIPAGVTVNVNSGARLYMCSESAFGINGTLNINGSADKETGFFSDAYKEHSASEATDLTYWGGLVVFPSGTLNANYAHISNVKNPDISENTPDMSRVLPAVQTATINGVTGDVIINNSVIDDCDIGVDCENNVSSQIKITNTKISAKYTGLNIFNTSGCHTEIDGNDITARLATGMVLSCISGPDTVVKNNHVHDCGEYVLQMQLLSGGADLAEFGTNVLDGKVALSGDLPSITLPEADYAFAGIVNVPTGKTVNVEAGAKIQCETDSKIQVYGTLNTNGIKGKNVRIRGNTATGNVDWDAVVVTESGSFVAHYTKIEGAGNKNVIFTYGNLELYNCTLSGSGVGVHAYNKTGKLVIKDSKIGALGNDFRPLNLNVKDASSLNISGNKFIAGKNAETAVYFMSIPNVPFEFSRNTISGAKNYSLYMALSSFNTSSFTGFDTNTFENKIYLGTYTTVNTNLSLPKANYRVSGLCVNENVSLTLAPGTIMQFDDAAVNETSYLVVRGTLNALGTFDEPIVFTSITDPMYSASTSPTYWGKVQVDAKGTLNAEYLNIKYSGATSQSAETKYGVLPTFSLVVKGKTRAENISFTKAFGSGIYLYETADSPSFNNTSFIKMGQSNVINGTNENIYAVYTKDADDVLMDYCYWDSPSEPPAFWGINGWTSNGIKVASEAGAGDIVVYNRVLSPHSTGSTYTLADIRKSVPNGNFIREYNDLEMTNSAGEFKITRIYNALSNKKKGLFGYGWNLLSTGQISDCTIDVVDIYGEISTITVSDRKTMLLPDGVTYTLVKGEDGKYTCTDGRFTVSYNTSTSSFTVTSKEKTVYTFNSAGKLTSFTERNGYKTVISYASNGNITQISDSSGRKYTFTFENGLVKTVADEMGNTVTYSYTNDCLTGVTDALGHTTVYKYDGYKNLTSITDSAGDLLESVTYYDTSTETHGRVNSITDINGKVTYYTYNDYSNLVTIYNSLGQYTFVTYDDNGYVTKTEYPDESTEITVYDTAVQTGEVSSKTDKLGQVTSCEKDENGNITKTVYPDGGIVQNWYDEYNNLIKTKDVNGVYTFYIYDANGKYLLKTATALNGQTEYNAEDSEFSVIETTYYDNSVYNMPGLIHTITDAAGRTTTYTYDQYGNIASTKDNAGQTAYFSYDKNGRLLKTTTPSGYETLNTYDNNGNLIKSVNDGGETYQYKYDESGNMTEEISPLGNKKTFTYYGNNLKKTETDAEGNTTSYTYNAAGNVATKTTPDGSVRRYVYDEMNRVTEEYLKDSSIGRELPSVAYIYKNEVGYRTVETRVYKDSGRYNSTLRFYDYKDRNYKTVNPDGSEVVTAYNLDGTIASLTNETGLTIYYKYDSKKQVSAQWTTKGNNEYAYIGYVYDDAGNVLTETVGYETVALYEVPEADVTYSTTYTYDAVGNLLTETSSDGAKKEYTYNNEGNVTSLKEYTSANEYNLTECTYDHMGNMTSQTVYVNAGDISGNDFASTAKIGLKTVFTYDAEGNVLSETTPNGVKTTYTYNKNGQPLTTAVNGVTKLTQTYDSMGNVATEKDALGNTASYTYDYNRNVLTATDALGNTSFSVYDSIGNLLEFVSPNSYKPGTAYDALSRTSYTYDSMSRPTKVSQTYYDAIPHVWKSYTESSCTYDAGGNILTETDGLSHVMSHAYSVAGEEVKTTDAEGYVTTYAYDALSRLKTQTAPNGLVTSYSYDSRGNALTVTSAKDSKSITVSSTYDYLGNVLSVTDGNGNTTVNTYNALGQLRSKTVPGDESIGSLTTYFQYDKDGNVSKVWDTTGKLNVYTYDASGNVLSETESNIDGQESITKSYEYDAADNMTSSTDGNGVTTTFTYDANGNMLSRTTAGKTTLYAYDKNGNVISETDPFGNTIVKQYDAMDREVRTVSASGVVLETKKYDSNDCEISSTDALGNVTKYTYDSYKRVTSVTDPMSSTVYSQYDSMGNLVKSVDGNGNETNFAYDAFSRLTSVTAANGEVTSYTYDNNGNMLTQTDPAGKTVSFEYNARNMLTKETAPDGKYEVYYYTSAGLLAGKRLKDTTQMSYQYDIHGRMISKAAGPQTVSYTYDNNGNVLTVSNTDSTITRTYDEFGRVLKRTDTGTGTVTYVYDITEGLESGYRAERSTDKDGYVTLKTYDKDGRLSTVSSGGETTTYSYYDNGSVKSVVYNSGAREEYTYNADNSLLSLVNKKSDGTVVNNYVYTYDKNGNILSKSDINSTTRYTYDSLNRLLTEYFPSGKTVTYEYDLSGNRSYEYISDGSTNTVISYTYNSANQLESTKKWENDIEKLFTEYYYDDNGNQLEKWETAYENGAPKGRELRLSNTYDNYNQLVVSHVLNGGAETIVNNAYNGEGLRIRKTVNGKQTNYRYEGMDVVTEYDELYTVKAQNTYGLNLISRTESGIRYYYLYNGHADVTSLLNSTTDALAATYLYDSFGTLQTSIGNLTNSYLYAGYQYDAETGLYYLNARMYDSQTARFMQEDTYRGNTRDPLSLNRYTYCANNPLIYEDPTGHSPIASAGIKAGLAVASAAKKLNKNVLASNKSLKPPSKSNVSAAKSANNAVMAATKSGVGYASGKVNKKPVAAMPNIAGSAIIAVADDLKKIAAKIPDYAENLVQQYTYLSTAVDNDVNGSNGFFGRLANNAWNFIYENFLADLENDPRAQVHFALDIAGFFVDFADLFNGIIYLTEGDWINTILAGLALIPVAGIAATLAKYAKKIDKFPGAFKFVDDAVVGVKKLITSASKNADKFFSWVKKGPQKLSKWADDIGDFLKRRFRKEVPDELPMKMFETPQDILRKSDSVATGKGGTSFWDMTEGGKTINGVDYSQHALERMAPNTPTVRAELSRRAEQIAEAKGLKVGTPEYYDFCSKYVDPRNIPPSVVNDAIRNTTGVPGRVSGTFVHQTQDITVVVNSSGKVITVIPN